MRLIRSKPSIFNSSYKTLEKEIGKFEDVEDNYWIGLRTIHKITSSNDFELTLELKVIKNFFLQNLKNKKNVLGYARTSEYDHQSWICFRRLQSEIKSRQAQCNKLSDEFVKPYERQI
jgi:hypothetical protein